MDGRSYPEGGAVAGKQAFDMVVFKILDRPVDLFSQLKQMKAADDTKYPAVACNTFGVLHSIADPGV